MLHSSKLALIDLLRAKHRIVLVAILNELLDFGRFLVKQANVSLVDGDLLFKKADLSPQHVLVLLDVLSVLIRLCRVLLSPGHLFERARLLSLNRENLRIDLIHLGLLGGDLLVDLIYFSLGLIQLTLSSGLLLSLMLIFLLELALFGFQLCLVLKSTPGRRLDLSLLFLGFLNFLLFSLNGLFHLLNLIKHGLSLVLCLLVFRLDSSQLRTDLLVLIVQDPELQLSVLKFTLLELNFESVVLV